MRDTPALICGKVWSTTGGKGHYVELEGRDPQVVIAEEIKVRDAEAAKTIYYLLEKWERDIHAESLKAHARLEGEIAARQAWDRDNERDGDPFSINPYDGEDRLRKIAGDWAAKAAHAKDTLDFAVETFLSKIPDKEATNVADTGVRKPETA